VIGLTSVSGLYWDFHGFLFWGSVAIALLLGLRHARHLRAREFLLFAGLLVLAFIAALTIVSRERAPGEEDFSYAGVLVVNVWLVAAIYLLVLGFGRLCLTLRNGGDDLPGARWTRTRGGASRRR
jgi:hypothetical protein